ncbi:MAG: flippase-like domain-containing protein [Verrucomicrobiae bacterium]|nr:flippase-like domain-containing protein [Verrucomicrobiae bacterium]
MRSGPSSTRESSGRRWLRRILVVGGLAALSWFAWQVDWPGTFRVLARLGWALPLVFVPYLLVYFADTAGWRSCFGHPPRLSWLRFLRIRWAGEAVNNVIPSGHVGGEAVKVLLLRRHGVSGHDGVPAAVISKTLQSVSQLAFLGLGAWCFLALGTAPAAFRQAMGGLLAIGTVALLAWVALQRRGLFASLNSVVRRFRAGDTRWGRKLAEWDGLDARIVGFRRNHPYRFAGALAFYGLGWLLDATEILVFAVLTGTPLSVEQAVAIEAFVGVAKGLTVFIPGALGVQEGSIVFLCRMAGVDETFGAAYALIRRLRDVVFASIGWKLLLLDRVRLRDLA